MSKLQITTQLSLQDYRKLTFHMLYRNPAIKGMTGFGVVFILYSLISLFLMQEQNGFANLMALGLVFTFFLPVMTFARSKHHFSRNKMLSEENTFTFDQERVTIEGTSFNTSFDWNSLYKIVETKDWILLYQNKQAANPIMKKYLSEQEIAVFHDLVKQLEGVKVKLKPR